MMKKSLIALAVMAATPVAFAATISGKIGVDVTSISGATNGSVPTAAATVTGNTYSANNNNSSITIADSEDLGGGMKAFFSLTYGLPMTSGGAISGQNQTVGVEGAFGKVFAGAFDNPLKVMGRGTELFADQSTGDSRYLTAVGHVEARANDVVAYISPSFNGAQFVVAHTNNPLQAGAYTDASNNTAMTIYKLAYTNGPLSVAYGHHAIDLASDEKADRVTASYKLGDVKLVGSWQKVENATTVASGNISAATQNGGDIKTWGVGAAYAMGPATLKAQYYSLKDDDATASDGAKMTAIGVDYALSKRTTVQVAYSVVKNEANATYGGAAAVSGSDTLSVTAGQDPKRVSIGLKHTF